MRTLVTATVLGLIAGHALADGTDNTLTNPSLENGDPIFPFVPEGWADIPLDGLIWGDTGNGDPARTGTRSMGIPAPGGSLGAFVGWSTNLFDQFGNLYDPPYAYQSGTPLRVSGYFNIPIGEELNLDPQDPPIDVVGIKLELRRIPPNFSIYESFEFTVPVSGTNGEWVYFEVELPDEMVGDFPPYPGSVTILPFRFAGLGVAAQGTIYWDDLCVSQSEPTPACPGDINTTGTTNGVPDGQTNLSDLQFFLTEWQNDLGMTPGSLADVNTTGTTNGMPDGEVNLSDLQFYLTDWQNGLGVCP